MTDWPETQEEIDALALPAFLRRKPGEGKRRPMLRDSTPRSHKGWMKVLSPAARRRMHHRHELNERREAIRIAIPRVLGTLNPPGTTGTAHQIANVTGIDKATVMHALRTLRTQHHVTVTGKTWRLT